MSRWSLSAALSGKGKRSTAFVAVVLVCLVLLVVLSRSVTQQLRALNTANSDNLQWTLGQLDVEYLLMRQAMSDAYLQQQLGRTPDLQTLRLKFDIFYSRLDTFRASDVYAPLRADAEFNRHFTQSWTLLQEMVPIIDTSDAGLIAALPALDGLSKQAAAPVRDMALRGLVGFAKESDERREAVFALLIRLAIVSMSLLFMISLLAFTLSRLYRLSERRALEQRLTGQRLKTIVGCSLDGIITCDADGKVLDWNDAAARIFQRTADAVQGKDFLRLILDPGTFAEQYEMIRGYIESGGSRRAERSRLHLQASRPDGSLFPLEMSIEFTGTAQEMIYVVFVRDISNQLKAESDLRAARDSALAGEKAKAQFIAVMSHEMRTPLNGLLGTLSLLRDTDLDAQQRQMLDTMDLSGRLLLSHVQDVLDLSKFEAGLMRADQAPFEPGRLLDEVVSNLGGLAKDRGNTLRWYWVGPPVPHAIGDARRLRQILINLASNAVKFTHNGDIVIEAELQDCSEVTQECTIEFRVIDSGIGIADVDLDRIFQDFETVDSSYSRNSGGTGLGLGIARRLTEVLDGEIGVESTLGEGSVFWLRVPLRAQSAADAQAAQEANMPHHSHEPERPLSILVVEDNMINRKLLRAMIEKEGHSVAEATNGREGVDLAAKQRFDLILMDISMPVMDGLQAARAILRGDGASAQAPIVAVTAHALPEELESFKASGMTQCLSKPIDRDTLKSLLASVQNSDTENRDTAAAGQTEVSDLDASVFESLVESIDAAPLADLISRFVEETDQFMAGLAKMAPETGQEDQMIKDLHHCAGAAAIFGAVTLRQRIHQVETEVKRGVKGAILRARPELIAIWQRTRLQILGLNLGKSTDSGANSR